MEQDFPESLSVTTLDWDFNICEHGSVSKHEFFQKLKVTHTESQSIDCKVFNFVGTNFCDTKLALL